jgi:hypothetical protein
VPGRHPKPTGDFIPIGEDPVLKQNVWYRKRHYSPGMLATFPAIDGLPTIVIGQAEQTESRTSSRWVITLLHEHFHQLQYSRPGYFAGVKALGLAGADQTGMWMLNYPFPYGDPGVKSRFAELSRALANALGARDEPQFDEKVAAYLAARDKFRSALKRDDDRYLAFQFWQEGAARYTEYRLAAEAAAAYEPSGAFKALKDYQPFGKVARTILGGIEKELASVEIDKAKRTVVYNFGAAECLVLDRYRPRWRERYFEEAFSLDKHFARGK